MFFSPETITGKMYPAIIALSDGLRGGDSRGWGVGKEGERGRTGGERNGEKKKGWGGDSGDG